MLIIDAVSVRSGSFFGTDDLENRHLALDHFLCDDDLLDLLFRRQEVHRIEKDLFEDHHQTARTDLALVRLVCDRSKGGVCELKTNIVELELSLILPDESVLRFGKDRNKCLFIELVQCSDHRQAADEFRDQAIVDEVLGFKTFESLDVTFLAGLDLSLKTERFV